MDNPAASLLVDHPLRASLVAELHARPFLRLSGSVSLTHYAIYSDEDPAIHESLVRTLCEQTGMALPADGVTHYAVQSAFGWHLKWERHTEFSTFTFVSPRDDTDYFNDLAIHGVPADWLALLAGKRFHAVRMELLSGQAAAVSGNLRDWLDGPVLVGSDVLGGGKVYCDWNVRADGYMRILAIDEDFREEQGGRLLQRLYEIETYRMMALLALPVARKLGRELDDIHASLQELMRAMDARRAGEDDAGLLDRLTELAVRVESLSGHSGRFSASRAYERIVLARIQELREQRIEGMPTIAEFMERRFGPAMETCRSVWSRHEQIAARVARAVDLLRTRVNLAQERDVTRLLAGLERTARNQLHLQHAVEGLSVAAISYYVLSIAAAGLKALHVVRLPLDPELAEGLLILPVVLIVFGVIKRSRTRTPQDGPVPAGHS
ncbi:DUF3422 family protein [Cupriavidus taiwanensis]|uniref:Membrane-anchored protein n=1 Tax=Cupriavidus taiwanensis TaxID=164546 RepID=A0A7Z7JGJ7_9BURK|nr:DUF3422 domain-containing protein [Cupriavidus taiwanensis]SOY73872.1 conserved hypothetical protein [Cupriavidus taiwanensis]SOZ10542.1 conserved hypothetical protein [Cupriavidus taiwanensis]SOZ12710.1 conserved hypothetical protein [Cupriavidus taiwanensis]SOZ44069.1 conserved hypothetical protein [Cupriavidus taiwanensis]SPC23410.1 conserved hypothetical protein [Cupriavidus taiwanensis]